jgi:hypothetical protein
MSADLRTRAAEVQLAKRRLFSALIAVSDRLDGPYSDAPDLTPWTRFVKPAMYALDESVRRLAAAAPPAGLSAPVPAENAPAVPEEAWDSIRAFAELVRRGSWSERQAAEFVAAVEALAVSGGAT